MYDRAREDKEYARSFLTAAELAEVDSDLEKDGYMTIQQVRDLVAGNAAKGSVEAGGLDPEIMALLDARINYKVFVAGDNIYTREELYDHYPFHELNTQPEVVFVQQEIGVFPPRANAMRDELEYLARDAGDESVDFVMLEDLVGQATRVGYKARRAPLRIAKTKIFIGKDQWDDFLCLQRVFRGVARIATAQLACSGAVGGPFALLSAITGGPRAPLLLADGAALEAEQKAREEEAARREEALRVREEALRQKEEEARQTQKRLDADLRRIEALVAAMSGPGGLNSRPRGPVPAGGTAEALPQEQAGDSEEDSVAL